jgi:hypothetical protein
MASPKKRFDVVAARPYSTRDGEEKKQWINVGRMTEWDDGGFSIELHAIPTGNWFDGRLSVFEPKPKDGEQPQRQARPQRQQSAAPADFDPEDLPF